MSTWFFLPLGDGMTAADTLDQIRGLFQAHFEAAGRPAGMAVFTRYDSEDHLHCEASAYFSPEAEGIAKTMHAQPCDRPLRRGLGLLAGAPEGWATLFPEI